jgi:hypothetical protein
VRVNGTVMEGGAAGIVSPPSGEEVTGERTQEEKQTPERSVGGIGTEVGQAPKSEATTTFSSSSHHNTSMTSKRANSDTQRRHINKRRTNAKKEELASKRAQPPGTAPSKPNTQNSRLEKKQT